MSIPPLIFGPVPPYTNPPINPQYYQPSRFAIAAITTGPTTTITTSINHNYVVGNECRVLIPQGYGTTQISGLTGLVTAVPAANQVTLNINSQRANSFILAQNPSQAQIVAIGDINTGAINTIGGDYTTFIPGSFIDISPA
jgi:hypothetical protein